MNVFLFKGYIITQTVNIQNCYRNTTKNRIEIVTSIKQLNQSTSSYLSFHPFRFCEPLVTNQINTRFVHEVI